MMKIFHPFKAAQPPHPRSKSAQAMTEFALTIPILLLLLVGIVEFGRMMQAWLALENGARFGVRYASTGNFNVAYCAEAAAALEQIYPGIGAEDLSGGSYDCHIPDNATNAEEKNNALQDWARLPSIRDASIAGAMGIAWNPDVSGDYNQFLSSAYSGSSFTQANKGTPGEPGFFNVMICSNRVFASGNRVVVNNNPYYYNPYPPGKQQDYQFPPLCETFTNNFSAPVRFVDDAGGPGDRVRVLLTYRHNLITPILSTWWPTLRLNSEREALVEKFRTSRVTGLSGGIAYAPTYTFTPPPTPTETLTPTITPTLTAIYCNGAGSVLRQTWLGVAGTGITNLTSWYRYPSQPDSSNYPTMFEQSQSSPDLNNYGTRWRAYLCPPYTGTYQFYIASDDSSELLLSGNNNPGSASVIASVNGYTGFRTWNKYGSQTSGQVNLQAGILYYIEAKQKEGSGGDYISVGWTGPSPLSQSPAIIEGTYLVPLAPDPTPTPLPASCNQLVALKGQNNDQNETLLMDKDGTAGQFSAYLRNLGPHPVNLTGAQLTYNNGWYNEMQGAPTTRIFNRYLWGSATMYDPTNGTFPLNHTFSAPYQIAAFAENYFKWDFTSASVFGIYPAIRSYPVPGAGTPTAVVNPNPDPGARLNFFWTSDFDASISYNVVPVAGPTVACSLDVNGLPGPSIVAQFSANPIVSSFYIRSVINTNNSNTEYVYFYIYDSAGKMVHWFKDTSTPFCFNNDCSLWTPMVNTWWLGGSGNPGPMIANGNYTLVIMAQNKDPRRKANLIDQTFRINASTPTVTGTATRTFTPTFTFTPTNTATASKTLPPSNTPTITRTPTITLTPSPTNTKSPTNTPTRTKTPTITPSPTLCLTPFEMGGCR